MRHTLFILWATAAACSSRPAVKEDAPVAVAVDPCRGEQDTYDTAVKKVVDAYAAYDKLCDAIEKQGATPADCSQLRLYAEWQQAARETFAPRDTLQSCRERHREGE